MKEKILIAEDDVILREILMSKLTSAGLVALGAEDGEETLKILAKEILNENS